jgi:site-specific DNA recombinase
MFYEIVWAISVLLFFNAFLEEAPIPIALHPATLDRYIDTVNALAETLANHAGAEDDRGSLIDDFRALVHSVTVHPKEPWQGFEVEVKGKLAALIGEMHFRRPTTIVGHTW